MTEDLLLPNDPDLLAHLEPAAVPTLGGAPAAAGQATNGSGTTASTDIVSAPVLPNLPADLWTARPALDHIGRAAHARGRSRDLVLGAVLARLSAMISPELRFDTGLGSGSLNLFVAAVGPSGTGKSTAAAVARELVAVPRHLAPETDRFRDGVPVGSGEGLVEVFMGMSDVETGELTVKGTPKLKKVRAQVRDNVFVHVDEGEVLVKIGERSGATIGPVLRSAWGGELLGQANAREETSRLLQPGSYALGMLIGFQPGTALPVLADAGPGTPQRFLWASATDPTVPDRPSPHPGQLAVHLVDRNGFAAVGTISFADAIREELWAGNLARVRGETVDAHLDSHRPLLMSKVAALLALLDNRHAVDEEDWQLARQIADTSASVRDTLVSLGETERAKEVEARNAAAVDRAVRTAAAVSSVPGTLERIARLLTAKVAADSGMTTGAAKRALAGRDRPLFDAAVEHAVQQQLLVRGAGGLRPGPAAAAA